MSGFISIDKYKVGLEVYNKDFILLRSEEPNDTMILGSLASAIFKKNFAFIEEVIHTEKEILLKLKGQFDYADIQKLSALTLESQGKYRRLFWPVYFDGPDWNIVSSKTQLSKQQIIEKLCQKEYEVAMHGFLPGFIYARNLDDSLHIPRKSSPVKKVAAGTFAIAEKYIGVYSLSSPGGWYRLGKMPCRMLNIPELPPVLMQLTDQIKIKIIDEIECEDLINQDINILDYNGLD